MVVMLLIGAEGEERKEDGEEAGYGVKEAEDKCNDGFLGETYECRDRCK